MYVFDKRYFKSNREIFETVIRLSTMSVVCEENCNDESNNNDASEIVLKLSQLKEKMQSDDILANYKLTSNQ